MLHYYNLNLPEEYKSWETLDLEALSESVVFGSVAFGNVHWGVLGSKDSGCASIFRGEFLAVAAIAIKNINKSPTKRKAHYRMTRFFKDMLRVTKVAFLHSVSTLQGS